MRRQVSSLTLTIRSIPKVAHMSCNALRSNHTTNGSNVAALDMLLYTTKSETRATEHGPHATHEQKGGRRQTCGATKPRKKRGSGG